jgi:hypothetical protein
MAGAVAAGTGGALADGDAIGAGAFRSAKPTFTPPKIAAPRRMTNAAP